MNRRDRIVKVLEEHGYKHDRCKWGSSESFTEMHFRRIGTPGMIIVRTHHSLSGLLEVFHIDKEICAGSLNDPAEKMPEMAAVVSWLEQDFSCLRH